MAKDNPPQREKDIHEYLITTYILCLLLMISSFIISQKFYTPAQIYPVINIRFFVIAGLVAISFVVLFGTKNSFIHDGTRSLSPAKLVYLSFPLMVTLVTMLAVNNSLDKVETILLLPVLVAASITGTAGGLAMATVCTVFLVFFTTVIVGNLDIYQAVERDLLFIGVMYVLGWFVGGLTNLEAEHRRQLNRSLSALREEIGIRKRAEEELRVLSCAVEQSPVMVVIAGTDGRIQYVNNSFSQFTGFSLDEVRDRRIVNYHDNHTEVSEQLSRIIDRGQEWKGEITSLKKDGESYWENAFFAPLRNSEGRITHIIKFAEDITGKKHMEREMAKLDRLNLVGEMAAGIGHEIRNPMTTVRGLLQLLDGRETDTRNKSYFELMIQELDRANLIITEYLSLARNKPVYYEMHNLTKIVRTMEPLMTADTLKTDMSLELDLHDVPDLMLDEKEIRQLLLNLVRNGLDAMEPGGRLAIKVYINENREVVLSVEDEGSGITPEVLEKIGTPFFTTKENGTGLGLAVCLSIALRHNAAVEFNSSDEGTAVQVIFGKVNHKDRPHASS